MDLWNGLVGYWPLDRQSYDQATHRFADKSAEGNHGTGSGDNLGDTFDFEINHYGIGSGATPFDGSSDFINFGDGASFDFTSENFTFAAWVYLNSLPISGSANTPVLFYKGEYLTNGYYLQLDMGPAAHDGGFRFTTSQLAASQITKSSAGILDIGKWLHIAVVRNGEDIFLYLNNSNVVGDSEAHINPVSSSDDFQICKYNDSTVGYLLDGIISQVYAYNRALTQDERTWLYLQRAGCYQTTSVMEDLGKLVKINKERKLKV